MASLVPSPMHQALSDLCAAIQQGFPTVADALKNADQQMAGSNGEAWVGPAARQWASELSGRSAALATQASAFEQEARSALASQPSQVTAAQAQTEARILAGRLQ